MNYLFIVAHPDDEIMGAGGLILKLLDRGERVKVVIMNGTEIESRPFMESDMKISHEKMGIREVSVYTHKNLKLNLEIPVMVTEMEKEIQEFEPDYVFTHFYGDIHPDHKAVYASAEQAVRFYQRHTYKHSIRGFFCMDVISSTNWGHERFKPDIYVGFSEELMDKKIEALSVYENVLRPEPHPRSVKAMKSYANALGAEVALPYAEGFKCIWARME